MDNHWAARAGLHAHHQSEQTQQTGSPVLFNNPSIRSIRQVLADKTGSGIAEGLGAVALLMILTMTVALGVTTDMKAVQTIAVKAERQSLVASLVGDSREGAAWGTPAAPSTETMTLENGRDVAVTMWREDTAVGTRLTAVTAISAGASASDCTTPASVEKSGCIYASRFHAGDLDSLEPHAIIRKDPSTATTGSVGTVDARVSTSTSMPQGTTFASGSDASATVWRYLIATKSLEATGEIRISQAGKTLAVVPVDAVEGNYFGTLTATINVPVTATITQGNLVVKTVYIYRAGGTS